MRLTTSLTFLVILSMLLPGCYKSFGSRKQRGTKTEYRTTEGRSKSRKTGTRSRRQQNKRGRPEQSTRDMAAAPLSERDLFSLEAVASINDDELAAQELAWLDAFDWDSDEYVLDFDEDADLSKDILLGANELETDPDTIALAEESTIYVAEHDAQPTILDEDELDSDDVSLQLVDDSGSTIIT